MNGIVKLLLLLLVILCLMPKPQVSATFWWLYCNIACFNNEDAIFTSDETTCFIYRNPCHLKRDTCRRRLNGLKPLSITTKADCQAKCPKDCGTTNNPVCGEYAGNYATFNNECLLLKTACENGLSIIKVYHSACPA